MINFKLKNIIEYSTLSQLFLSSSVPSMILGADT